jgi:hypothetical protein
MKKGDDIVCVKAFLGLTKDGLMVDDGRYIPIKGHSYVCDGFQDNGFMFLLHINTVAINGRRHSYNPSNFRKLDDLTQDISEQIKECLTRELELV